VTESLLGVRSHWLFAILLAAGFALRLLAQLAYQPALLYIDSMRYLYNAYPGADPVGYKAPLKAMLAVGDLPSVTAVQHLLGLAMAVTIYLTLLRRDIPRWLAAVAVAPVLLDAYQIQIEQNIMPDVWFEALLVAGIAILLYRLIGPGVSAVIAAGLVLGAAATIRQVGEILILPGLLFLLTAGGGWRTIITRSATFTAAFAVPIAGYMAGSYLITGHLWLASSTPSISSYGRMATAADCAALRIPAYERGLCPTAGERAHGIDWLDHDVASPLKTYSPPAGLNRYAVIAGFDRQVSLQQPGRVLTAIAADGLKLFALTRTSSQTGTPISRWQFQQDYPTFGDWVMLGRHHVVVFGLRLTAGSATVTRHVLDRSYGGPAAVSKGPAAFLRAYQLHGGYTAGPVMLIFTLAGLAGSVLVVGRRAALWRRRRTQACLAFFATGAAILVMSDAFQFSWRYQLPALVTLPPAGALGLTVATSFLRAKRPDDGSERMQAAELASPATSEPGRLSAYLLRDVDVLKGCWHLAQAGEQVCLGDRRLSLVTHPNEAFAAEHVRRDLRRDLAEPRVGDLARMGHQRVALALQNRPDVHLGGDPCLGLGELALLFLGHLPFGNVLASSAECIVELPPLTPPHRAEVELCRYICLLDSRDGGTGRVHMIWMLVRAVRVVSDDDLGAVALNQAADPAGHLV